MVERTYTFVPGQQPSVTVPDPTERELSSTIFGDYKILRKIGAGGMGEVYEAIQLKLDRKVALKFLSGPLASQPEFLQRFEREAKSAASLNHPNLVQVYDFGSI